MQSKKLKEIIRMTMDVRAMDGPVTRRGLAEEIMRVSASEHWSAADEYNARLDYLMGEIKQEMMQVHSDEFIARELSHAPEELRDTLRKIPQWICVTARGGRGSEHVKAVLATPEQWAANFALKDQIVEATRVSRNESRDIQDLLETTGASCLADLLKQDAA